MSWRCRVLLLIMLGAFLMNMCTVWAMAESNEELLIIESDITKGLIELEYEGERSSIDCDYMEWILKSGERCRLLVKTCEDMTVKITINGETVSLTDGCYEFICEGGLTEIFVSCEEHLTEVNPDESKVLEKNEISAEEAAYPCEEKALLTENTNKVSAISYDATVTYLNDKDAFVENTKTDEKISEIDLEAELVKLNEELECDYEGAIKENCEIMPGSREMETIKDSMVFEIGTPAASAEMEETAADTSAADEMSTIYKMERGSYMAADSVHKELKERTAASDLKTLKMNKAANRKGTIKTSLTTGDMKNLTKNLRNSRVISMNSSLFLVGLCCMIIARVFWIVFN